ncbi:transketolase [Roseovarius sp. D0-M9]|uniref:transketolase n=1 Tax=Roseovarius sp. D0-M9 TaxID=3127117 RepID=UPI00300FE28A
MPTKRILLATALSIAVINPSNAATQTTPAVATLADANTHSSGFSSNIVLVKNDKNNKGGGHQDVSKGHQNKNKGKKNDKKAEKKADKYLKKNGKKNLKEGKQEIKAERKREDHGNRIKRSMEDRVTLSQRLMTIPAPSDRDMSKLLSALPLALLGQNVAFQNVDQDRMLTYRNCPPGLAKKDPPCVPPGLARDGITYDQWVSYDDQELERIYQDRRDRFLRSQEIDVGDIDQIDDSGLLLSSDQVARLYDLSPAPVGQRYALIDGMPVLLEDRNYAALAGINDMALVPRLSSAVQVAPTAALTQDELMQAYRLPKLDPGYSYTVLNGEVLALENDAFDTLQLIRVVRSVF